MAARADDDEIERDGDDLNFLLCTVDKVGQVKQMVRRSAKRQRVTDRIRNPIESITICDICAESHECEGRV